MQYYNLKYKVFPISTGLSEPNVPPAFCILLEVGVSVSRYSSLGVLLLDKVLRNLFFDTVD